MKKSRWLLSVWSFIVFFAISAFVVTCCFYLFLSGVDLSDEVIRQRGGITFLNVILLSALITLIDAVKRKFTVERPVKRILKASKKITEGDFSVRIEPVHNFDGSNEFDMIIENFNKMVEELSSIETLRTDFIANVSHELKTPLSVIQNYTSMLSAPNLTEEKRIEYADSISRETKRFTEMITNILKLNKLENQKIFSKLTVYELNEQLCECLLNFEEQWEKKNLVLETYIDEIVTVKGDPDLLCLVWNNLISNAVKFTDNGGKISVKLTSDNDYAVVSVSDTGCGISPEEGKHIFEKFYQGDSSRSTQGNGLGLALVKRVVNIVGGEISVESEKGKGSTFTVKLKRGTENNAS